MLFIYSHLQYICHPERSEESASLPNMAANPTGHRILFSSPHSELFMLSPVPGFPKRAKRDTTQRIYWTVYLLVVLFSCAGLSARALPVSMPWML